jgi:hypothetical protein
MKVIATEKMEGSWENERGRNLLSGGCPSDIHATEQVGLGLVETVLSLAHGTLCGAVDPTFSYH